MIITNLRTNYTKSVVKAYALSGFLFYLIFGINSFFSILLFNSSQSSYFFIIGAIYFYLCHKYFIPYVFLSGLKCPKCDKSYIEYSMNKTVRMDLLNQTPCRNCKYQGHFEM